jgi:hypothetical protein
MFGFRCVDADQADTFARAEQKRISIDDMLDELNVSRRHSGVGWIVKDAATARQTRTIATTSRNEFEPAYCGRFSASKFP